MTNVLLIIQLLVAIALVAVILMQQSEGGALGVGGSGGMMSGRGAANVLTQTTMILGALFIANSILLAIVIGVNSEGQSVFERSSSTVLPAIPADELPADGVPTDG